RPCWSVAARGRGRQPAALDGSGPPDHRLYDLRQHLHRAAAVVELPAAVIGDVDPADAMIKRDPGVLYGRDALKTERDVERALDALDGAPIERRLEFMATRAPAACHHMALGEVALAPAVDGGINCDAEPHVAVGDGT